MPSAGFCGAKKPCRLILLLRLATMPFHSLWPTREIFRVVFTLIITHSVFKPEGRNAQKRSQTNRSQITSKAPSGRLRTVTIRPCGLVPMRLVVLVSRSYGSSHSWRFLLLTQGGFRVERDTSFKAPSLSFGSFATGLLPCRRTSLRIIVQ